MKAKELAKILLENPDFDVVASFFEEVVSFVEEGVPDWGVSLRTFEISGYGIGYSDKQIYLDIKETDA